MRAQPHSMFQEKDASLRQGWASMRNEANLRETAYCKSEAGPASLDSISST